MKIPKDQPTNTLPVAALMIDLYKAANHLSHAVELCHELGIYDGVVIDLDALESAEHICRSFLDRHKLQIQPIPPKKDEILEQAKKQVESFQFMPPTKWELGSIGRPVRTLLHRQFGWTDEHSGATFHFSVIDSEIPQGYILHSFKESIGKALFRHRDTVDPGQMLYLTAHYINKSMPRATLPGERTSVM